MTAVDELNRWLALVPYLQKGEAVPVAKIAADFGVSPAQIRKDLDHVWMCGLPELAGGDLIDLAFEPDGDDDEGSVRVINADFLQRPLRLTATEASALAVAVRAVREGSNHDIRAIADRVLVKLDNAFADAAPPVHSTEGSGRGQRAAELASRRALLEQAISGGRQAEIAYYVPSRDQSTTRVVDPSEIVRRDGIEYLDAWCHLAEARRTFRLDRIDRVEVLDAAQDSQLEGAERLPEQLFRPEPDADEAVLRVPATDRWVADYYPVITATETGDGGLEVRLKVADRRWITQLVLGLGPGTQVIEPADLADQVRGQAVRALSLYGAG